jgi:hypothetical protein
MPAVERRYDGGHIGPDHCIDLLEDLIPGAEREAILTHVATCAVCEVELRDHAARRERLRATALPAPERANAETPRAQVGSAAPSWRRLLETLLPSGPRRRFAIAGALAAIIAIAVVPRMARLPSTAVEPRWLDASASEVVTRTPTVTGADSLVRAGLDAYRRRDLAEARRLLSLAPERGRFAATRNVFLASTLALEGDPRAASEILSAIPMEKVPEPWRSESRWTHAAVLQTLGETARADSLLDVLAEEPGPLQARARQALRRK